MLGPGSVSCVFVVPNTTGESPLVPYTQNYSNLVSRNTLWILFVPPGVSTPSTELLRAARGLLVGVIADSMDTATSATSTDGE